MKPNYPRYPVAFFPDGRRTKIEPEPPRDESSEKTPAFEDFGRFSNPFGTAFENAQ